MSTPEWGIRKAGCASVLLGSSFVKRHWKPSVGDVRLSRASPDPLDDPCHKCGHPLSVFHFAFLHFLTAPTSFELAQENWTGPRLGYLPSGKISAGRTGESPGFELPARLFLHLP